MLGRKKEEREEEEREDCVRFNEEQDKEKEEEVDIWKRKRKEEERKKKKTSSMCVHCVLRIKQPQCQSKTDRQGDRPDRREKRRRRKKKGNTIHALKEGGERGRRPIGGKRRWKKNQRYHY